VQKHIGRLWIAGFFGSLAIADAQTPPSPTASTQFDGTYAFVSGTKVNETFFAPRTEHILRCGNYPKGGPLTIMNGQARFSAGGPGFEGRIGSRGELVMRRVPEPASKAVDAGIERVITGRIDGDGTVRARRMDCCCNYDLVWQKQ
jgi:hypothetical protein